jgi:hypothetical protein
VRQQVTVAIGAVPAVHGVGAVTAGIESFGFVRGDDLADVGPPSRSRGRPRGREPKERTSNWPLL